MYMLARIAARSSSSRPLGLNVAAKKPSSIGPTAQARTSTNTARNKVASISNLAAATSRPRQTESVWESYGFEQKDCGWGAWYLVP
ncbi:hypothetical protein ACA910_004313 [Epithemia clementina (nom. ined.)]